MARTKIDVQGVINANGQINSAKRTVNSIRDDLDWTRGQISSSILNRSNLQQRLRNVSNSLRSVENRMNRIKVMVENGANSYKTTDRGVVTRRANIGKVSKKVIASGGAGLFVPVEPIKQAVEKVEIKEKYIVIPKHVLNNAKILSGVDYTYDFLNARNHVFDALASAWGSNWINNVLSLFGVSEDLNEKAVRRSIKFLIKDTLKNRHESSEFLEEYTDALSPDEFENFKKVVDLFADTGTIYTDVELAEILKIDVREISESQYIQFLRQQGNAKFFKSLSDKLDLTLGAYSDATEAFEVASQMISRVMNDYTEDIKYLEAIKQALIDGGYDLKVVNETVDDMLWDYKNQAFSAIMIGVDKLCEEGAGTVINKTIPTLNLFLAAKDLGCSVSGLDDTTENLEMIYATQQYSYGLVEKYEYYADKIRTGEYTEQDVEQCNIYFELARTAKIQEYTAMSNMYENAKNEIGTHSMGKGVIQGIASLFTSEEEKQILNDAIDILDDEIIRLQDLDGVDAVGVTASNHFAEAFPGGSMGGR